MKSITEIKIRGYHLDVYQHVNNARYLEFLEEGRWNYIDEIIDKGTLMKKGLLFNVVRIEINYRKGAMLGDVIRIETDILRIGNKSVTLKQDIYKKDTVELIADAEVTFVFVDMKTGISVVIDEEIQKMCGQEAGSI